MGKQKQQVISRFFASKPKPTETPSPTPNPPPPPPSPKISATVSFSPSNKRRLSLSPSPSPKPPKLPKPTTTRKPLFQPSPSPSLPSPSPNYTPLEAQVIELKKLHPDVLLMVEVGYKYRFFGADAEKAAAELGIYAHVDHNFLTASVPTFRLGVHLRRLVAAGYKVGVVKQTETAAVKASGPTRGAPFERGLSAVYTRATLAAAAELGGDGGGDEGGGGDYLVCVAEEEGESGEVRIGVVGVEISTGDVVYGGFEDGVMRNGLEAFLVNLSPSEILLASPLSKLTHKLLIGYAGPASHVRLERVSRECFDNGGALAEVTTLYENTDESNKGNHHSAITVIMEMPDLVVQALALTIRYLKQFGLEKVLCVGASFRPFSSNFEMTLSANALQQLQILHNNSDGSESGSLLHTMNHTVTPFGSRLLRHWVTHPLRDRTMIIARLDAVSEISEAMGSFEASQHSKDKLDIHRVLSSVLAALERAPDIQRGITRIFHRTASPSEFVAVIHAILDAGKNLQKLHTEEHQEKNRPSSLRSELLKKLILSASSLGVISNSVQLLSSLNKNAAEQRDLQNLIICNDQFPEVAASRKNVQLAKEKLDSLIGLYRKQLRMSKLEFTSVSGTTHLIELSLDVKVPSNWVKINSTKKTIRYHTPEVLASLNTLSVATEELNIICQSAWNTFLGEFGKYYVEFQVAVQALASLDCLHSLAILSRNKNFVRPVFVNDTEPVQIHITAGRHPVLEGILQENFVPNDTDLHAEREHCQIVTGPNMGGKSCYIRQVALIAIMAQVGSFVPASSAKLHVLDGIYTRMGASDSIQQGRSTFLEELSEASNILRDCTSSSLVILDELGRGTSTHDGVAIAHATLHHLLRENKSAVLFVTHYPEIADIRSEFPGCVEAYHVSYLASAESDNDVTYLYKLVPGVSEKSFGFKVAELAQIPLSCVHRASLMAAKLEALVKNRVVNKCANRSRISDTRSMEEDSKKEMFKDYEKFFFNLNAAISTDCNEKSFELLCQAKVLAKDLIYKHIIVGP